MKFRVENVIVNSVLDVPYDKQKSVIGESTLVLKIHMFQHILNLYCLIFGNNDEDDINTIEDNVNVLIYTLMEVIIIETLKFSNDDEELNAFIKNDLTNNYKSGIFPFEETTKISGYDVFMNNMRRFEFDEKTVRNYIQSIVMELQQSIQKEVIRGRIIKTRYMNGLMGVYAGIDIFRYRYLEAKDDLKQKNKDREEEKCE